MYTCDVKTPVTLSILFKTTVGITVQSPLSICGGLVLGPPANNQIFGCSSPLYKTAQYLCIP